MNIYDVSKKAGVSIATVSRVLNGNNNVAEKTKKKVLAAMNELDYTPNIFARGLGLNTMKTIGIMCSDSSDTYLANAVYYIQQALQKYNYDSILCCTGYETDAKEKYLSLLQSKRVDGIVLVGSHFVIDEPGGNDYIISAAKDIPIIMINGYIKGENIYSIRCDDYSAIRSVTNSLIDAGHEKIVYLYSSTSQSGKNKLSGFNDALIEHNISLNTAYTDKCGKNIFQAKEYLNFLYKKRIPFDAVIASEDYLAVGAVKFASENGIKVPEHLEIVGYNNSVLANCTEPELTSINSKVEVISSIAVETLLSVLRGENVPKEHIEPADIIKRKTTKF